MGEKRNLSPKSDTVAPYSHNIHVWCLAVLQQVIGVFISDSLYVNYTLAVSIFISKSIGELDSMVIR